MQSVRLSRKRVNIAICSSRRGRHERDSRAQSALVGVRSSGNDDPRLAAAAAWYDTARDPHGVMTTLATTAAVHVDAHLVKYTLACFDAAAADPPSRQLYMAAAAALCSWWTVQDRQSP